MIQRVTCNICHKEVEVALYFSDEKIVFHDSNALRSERTYEAYTHGKAICPLCGSTIEKPFKKYITKSAIIKLAGGYEE